MIDVTMTMASSVIEHPEIRDIQLCERALKSVWAKAGKRTNLAV
ncbi:MULTISPECIES: hypothetical protein [Paraburkholderia]|uniref:Uncharacterized protein n=2 Tax=Paraburkholderia TaxID=1822464 RepID=A0ABU9S3S7_9BURK|nr:hypothetical protein [Paraburkholderia nodosa]